MAYLILDGYLITPALRALEEADHSAPAMGDLYTRLSELAAEGMDDQGSFYDGESSHLVITQEGVDLLAEAITLAYDDLAQEFAHEVQEEGESPANLSLLWELVENWKEDEPESWVSGY